jgi:hypothetical protein
VDPIITARATAYLALGSAAAFTIAAVGDVDLLRPSYVVTGGGTTSTALSLWPVRPTVLAGFTFTAFGGGLFERGSP